MTENITMEHVPTEQIIERTYKYRFHDRLKSLEALGEYHGLFEKDHKQQHQEYWADGLKGKKWQLEV